MQTVHWNPRASASEMVDEWCRIAAEPGIVHVVFGTEGREGLPEGVPWDAIQRWLRVRAVTVADVRVDLHPPALDVALCSDLVYLHTEIELRPDMGTPTAGWLFALGRAGRAALARGLLDPSPIAADQAVALGLAQGRIGSGGSIPLPTAGSTTALTIARDLMRSTTVCGASGRQLELAAFRLLFASGDPERGARAFLDRREPRFRQVAGADGCAHDGRAH